MKDITLVIMAAGMGSRYGGLKQIDPIGANGEIILDYSVYDAIEAGFDKVVFVIKHEIEEDFKEIMQGKYEDKIKVEYAYQDINNLPEGYSVPEGRTKPWGTGHECFLATASLTDPLRLLMPMTITVKRPSDLFTMSLKKIKTIMSSVWWALRLKTPSQKTVM